MKMRKLLFLALFFCFITGGLLFAQDELKVKFSGYADFHGIYYDNPDTGFANYMEGRLRPYFNFAKGDVNADLKLEIDPIMGKDTDKRYFDFGADQVDVIEVKNAYLEVKKMFNYIDFKGGVFGYKIPGDFVISDDVPGFMLGGNIGRFRIDASMLKFQEGNTGVGTDDTFYFTLWALTDTTVRPIKARPGGILKIAPIISVAADKHFKKLAYIPQLYLDAKYGPVTANLVGAAAFGTDKSGASDVDYSSFGVKLESTIKLKPAYVKVFGIFESGDNDAADDKNKNFGDGFITPAPDIKVTNYIYEGGLEGIEIGKSEKLYTDGSKYGIVTLGGGIGKTFKDTTLEAIAAYHMAAAEPPAPQEKGYGFEVNLNAKQKVSKNAMLEGELNVFVPGEYFTKKKDVAIEVVVGPSFKW
jgi:hypothetical protein